MRNGAAARAVVARVQGFELAGGRVTGLDGRPFTSRGRSVLATNHLIHDAMLDVIRGVE